MRLREAAERIKAGETTWLTVREFLGWFGFQRRSYWNVRAVRDALVELGLTTIPNFEYVWLDSPIRLATPPPLEPEQIATAESSLDLGSESEAAPRMEQSTAQATPLATSIFQDSDPTYRVGRLQSANRPPLFVSPDAPLAEIVTNMLMNDYSQLPVMTSSREVKGMVSWKAIGMQLSLGKSVTTARDCMEPAHEVKYDEPLFTAVDIIIKYEYVLIRNEKKEISGIVTTTDVSLTFDQLGEQFLLLGEIENHIRALIDGKYTVEQLREAADSADTGRSIDDVSDLTFGEYIRLLENQERWIALGLQIDRSLFVKELDRVREIRNDVMHFDPDGIEPSEINTLRRFLRFLQRLMEVNSSGQT
jgi:hypothetical protein